MLMPINKANIATKQKSVNLPNQAIAVLSLMYLVMAGHMAKAQSAIMYSIDDPSY